MLNLGFVELSNLFSGVFLVFNNKEALTKDCCVGFLFFYL